MYIATPLWPQRLHHNNAVSSPSFSLFTCMYNYIPDKNIFLTNSFIWNILTWSQISLKGGSGEKIYFTLSHDSHLPTQLKAIAFGCWPNCWSTSKINYKFNFDENQIKFYNMRICMHKDSVLAYYTLLDYNHLWWL